MLSDLCSAIVFRIIWELSRKTFWTSPMFVLYKIDLVEESLQNCVLYHKPYHLFKQCTHLTLGNIQTRYGRVAASSYPLIGLATGRNISFIECANLVWSKRNSFYVRTAKYPQLLTVGYHTKALPTRKKLQRNTVDWFVPSFSCITCL